MDNIVVCVKQVPDTYSERKLDPGDKTLDRAAADGVINELDEYAIEEALRLAEASGGTVTVLTMGPEKALDSIRKALAMGADKAVHVVDDALHGADAVQTSAALAAALGGLDADLVLLGSESTDARMSVIPAMLAERLSLPQLTYASEVAVDGSRISIRRQTEYGYERVEATLPAVVSVVEKINEPRYPSFKGIMAAKKKELKTLGAADLGLAGSGPSLATAATEVTEFASAPPKGKGVVVTDEGEGGARIVAYLADQKLL
jgi:electron transfer flavoprotein beta subunit